MAHKDKTSQGSQADSDICIMRESLELPTGFQFLSEKAWAWAWIYNANNCACPLCGPNAYHQLRNSIKDNTPIIADLTFIFEVSAELAYMVLANRFRSCTPLCERYPETYPNPEDNFGQFIFESTLKYEEITLMLIDPMKINIAVTELYRVSVTPEQGSKIIQEIYEDITKDERNGISLAHEKFVAAQAQWEEDAVPDNFHKMEKNRGAGLDLLQGFL